MKKFCWVLILFFLNFPIYSQVYKWVDGDGVVHFSDTPHENAQKINVEPAQSFSAPENSSSLPGLDQQKLNQEQSALSKNYKISITQPLNETTIRNPQGYVPVIVDITPTQPKDYSIQLLLDNQPIGEPKKSLLFALNNVLRGAHTITAQLLNDKGKVIATSQSVSIFMHQPRVGMVPQTRPAGR